MKPCEHYLGKNSSKFGVDLIQNSRMAAILDSHCNVLHVTYFRRDSLAGPSLCLRGNMGSAECLYLCVKYLATITTKKEIMLLILR